MRRFLVVGCGGSGGKTLAYLMDQLRSELAAHGVHKLPPGWKFVHLDVPSVSEGGPPGLDNVQKQGGVYYGTGAPGASYRVLDNSVSQRFEGKRKLDCIATWAPRDPDSVITPIADGAGQYRAVGRMITLSRAVDILKVLNSVWEELNTEKTRVDMAELDVPGLGSYNKNTPIVLVVSSMAGGAGASMALDVCRLLTLISGLNPKLMGVFLVAPNIFDTLPAAGRTGVRPNALAMLGEIVASQTNAAASADMEALVALGLNAGAGEQIPFARVFPVGRFVGAGEVTRFGDGRPDTVYRGLGRGLAGLIMSGTATEQFVSYDLGNTASPNGDRDLLGWASQWEPLPWGSYGFASLSMGRDRYAEYAAQRIARRCVRRLLEGHLQRGNRASGNEQINALVDAQWPSICQRIGIPAGDTGVGEWLSGSAYPWSEADVAAAAVVDRALRPFIPQASGQQIEHWMTQLRAAVPRQEGRVRQACRQAAEDWAYRWHRDLLARIEDTVRDGVALLGLPYGKAVVDRLTQHFRDVLAPQAEQLVVYGRVDVTAVPASIQPMAGKNRGEIRNGQQLTDQLVHGYRTQARTQIFAQAADIARALLLSLADEVLRPMTDALVEGQSLLVQGLASDPTDVGLARLATDYPSAWPSDEEAVPSRFDHADNEVLLTSSTHFQEQFAADVQRAISDAPDRLEDRYAEVVRQIVAGAWRTTGAEQPPFNLLESTAVWRSRVFKNDPQSGQPLMASPAGYDAHVRPAELLGRARQFVRRPDESFHRFCRLSIRDYVQGDGASESERTQREKDVVAKFASALNLARPLISVDSTALQAVHNGASVQYRYKFSEVPFKGRLTTAEALLDVLRRDTMIDIESRSNLENAIGDSDGVTRLDIFGSYPNYSPLVFDAVLGPVAEQWAEVGDINRESFWQWRRSRPLPAALPMGDIERRAMIAGWFLGQVVGRIRIPAAPYREPVRIFDAAGAAWVSFPDPLLTPPSRFIAPYDWLPAVLESVLIAIARSHQRPVMSSLRPYRVLRSLYDDATQSRQNTAAGMNVLAANRNLGEWLAGRSSVPGGQSRATGADTATTVDERADAAVNWLNRILDLVRNDYLSPDMGGRGGTFAVIGDRVQASRTPMFRDLAADVDVVVAELIDITERERVNALKPLPEHEPVPHTGVDRRFDVPTLDDDTQF